MELEAALLSDVPAIFLVKTDFILAASKQVYGVTPFALGQPADHLRDADQWYMKTMRVFGGQVDKKTTER